MRKIILKTYIGIISAGILYCIFIKLTKLSFPCPFFEITGLKCAGCGTTRMFLSLIKFDFKSAFYYNPVMLCLFVFWIAVSFLLFSGRPKLIHKPAVLTALSGITAAVLVLYSIFRNF